MQTNNDWFVRSENGNVYGPANLATLIEWAKEGRIEPSGFVSSDCKVWKPAQLMRELEMAWIIEAEPGKFFGPFNRAVVSRLNKAGEIPEGANVYRRHDFAIDEDPPPVIVEKIVEVPVEKIVEKIVEVPVEKIVEKIVEVEKIIEVEPPPRKSIVDDNTPSAVAIKPPEPVFGGIFKGANREKMQALEAELRRELANAKPRNGGLKNLFSGRKS